MSEQDGFAEMTASMKKAAAALRDAGVPHLLGGGLALWAYGAPETGHDVDFLVKPEDAERAAAALGEAGMRIEQPPEEWLVKAFDGDVLIDLIHEPTSGPITDETLERGRELEVLAMRIPVARAEDVMAQKLLSISEHEPDFSSVLEPARALREQIDWDDVRRRTESSAFARAFFTIAEGLEIVQTR
ncbi:MAG: nucleotidyltransferase [Gaiellaceae bacterium]